MMRVLSPPRRTAGGLARHRGLWQVVAPFHSHRRRLSTAHICRHHEPGGAGAGGLAAVLAGARGEVLEAANWNVPMVRSPVCGSYRAI